MAISAADMNQARVDILGTTVDNPGATWITAPAGSANRLTTTERIITRAINQLNTNAGGVLDSVTSFVNRFGRVVGEDGTTDQTAFDSIGMNLIQAVAALIEGGITPGTLSLEFEFPDPLATGDFVEVQVPSDITIPAQLAGSEYLGMPEPGDMHFELTAQPAGTVIGQVDVLAGNVVTMHGGASVSSGMTLRMTATDIVGGPVSPNAKITVAATRKTAPVTAGRYEHHEPVADTEWVIPHNLDTRIVSVQVVSAAGNQVIGSVDYETDNRCVLTFCAPVAGTAVVRR